ncbi:MAG TPA: D-glycerate dehydrogenase [Nitrososphaeraceae archaeon]|nr:D-glycerate dehydrogenase [Nitrososphaeraceae archaeon]
MTRKILEPALSMLLKECNVVLNNNDRPPTRKEILKNVRGKDGILCMLSDKIDAEVMAAAGPKLKVISSYSTGVDHIDVDEATKRGIYVTFTSNILAEATADLTFALILALARKIIEANEFTKSKLWKVGWMPNLLLGTEVYGMTLGIIGLGRIGTAVARRAKGFNMKIIYNNRSTRNHQIESELKAEYVDMNNILEQSDFLSIHTTLNKDSFHLLDESKFKKMKKTAYIINTSRGQIINEPDLIKAIKNNWIAGVGLDVFEKEPLSNSSPLLKMKNVVALPHIGSATYQTRSRMSEVAVQNLLRILNGRDPLFIVNSGVKKKN